MQLRRRQRMVASIFLLMSVCVSSKAGEAAGKGMSIVADCSLSTGEVLRFDLGQGEARAVSVVGNSAYFHCVPSGQFIYRDKSARWHIGNAWSPKALYEIAPPTMRGKIDWAVLSSRGDMVAWVIRDKKTTTIAVTRVKMKKGKPFISITKSGIIAAPSWSPDGSQIAYYSGPPDAYRRDGFALVTLSVMPPGAAERQIAPPSLSTRLSPDRSFPPRWSPNGELILFEGRYNKEVAFPWMCVVEADGGIPRHCIWGDWSSDSRYVLGVKLTGSSKVGYERSFIIVDVLAGHGEGQKELDIALPPDLRSVAWSPDGDLVAFLSGGTTAGGNDLWLVDLKAAAIRKIADCEWSARLQWIRGTDLRVPETGSQPKRKAPPPSDVVDPEENTTPPPEVPSRTPAIAPAQEEQAPSPSARSSRVYIALGMGACLAVGAVGIRLLLRRKAA